MKERILSLPDNDGPDLSAMEATLIPMLVALLPLPMPFPSYLKSVTAPLWVQEANDMYEASDASGVPQTRAGDGEYENGAAPLFGITLAPL